MFIINKIKQLINDIVEIKNIVIIYKSLKYNIEDNKNECCKKCINNYIKDVIDFDYKYKCKCYRCGNEYTGKMFIYKGIKLTRYICYNCYIQTLDKLFELNININTENLLYKNIEN